MLRCAPAEFVSRLIYVLAGEHSGDVLGARLISSLRAREPDLGFAGVGGPRMVSEGLKSLFPMQDLAMMGLLEVLPNLRRLGRRLAEAAADIAARRPDVVVTIDSPDFMLRLLKTVAPLRIRRAHYVAPQVWAWREGRVRHFRGRWDRLLCLLPFEPGFFARHGVPARFVGHPVLESGADRGNAERFRERHGIPADARVVVLMPGSRSTEVRHLLPVYGKALGLLKNRVPGLKPVLPVAAAVAAAVRRGAAQWPFAPLIVGDADEKHDAYAAAEAALTKSGTSTLELALAGVPMAVTYRVGWLNAAAARRLIQVPHVAMVNLLAGKQLVPELLQERCTPHQLADALGALLANRQLADEQVRGFKDVLATLRPPEGLPSAAAAQAVLELLHQA
jgi:lipid-A-disaccharide synthase